MTLLGGMGTIFGPVVGAFVIITMENYLAELGVVVHDHAGRHLRGLRAGLPSRHHRRAGGLAQAPPRRLSASHGGIRAAGPRAQRRQPRRALAGLVPEARGRYLARQGRRAPRRARLHLRAVRGALPAARLGARAARRRARRHRRDHGAQRPGDARGPLRRAGPRGRAQRAQLPARRAHDRVLPRARRGEGAHRRPRVLARRGEGARAVRVEAARRRHRRPAGQRRASSLGQLAYEALLEEGDPAFVLAGPRDEWDSLGLLYTSGTTGDPKGVVYHHRGAYLNALGNALAFGLTPQSVYLWTLPMFHCNGWTYTWAVTAVGRHARVPAQGRSGAHLPGHRAAPRDAPVRRADRAEHARARARGGEGPLRPCRGGRHGRRGAALGGHRGHGAHGLSRDAPLRPHRELRPGHAVRLAGRLGGARSPGARAPHGAPGRALSDARGPAGRRPAHPRAGAARRPDAGRGDAARQHDHEGLPREPEGDRGGLPRGLVPHRRPRGVASRRLHRGEGPLQGHHHLGRREHLLARGRGVPLPAPAGDGGRGRRPARREVGRDAVRLRDAQARGGRGRRRGHHRLVPRAPRALQGAANGRLRGASRRPRPGRSRSSSCASGRGSWGSARRRRLDLAGKLA